MDRPTLLKLWDESWDTGIWFAPWTKALDAPLTPEQAAWKPPSPAGPRHSIWQNVNHVCIWREYTLTKIYGRPGPTSNDMPGLNFAEPPVVSDAEWAKTRERLQRSHTDIRALIVDESKPLERALYHLGHDCYHMGQIMYVRAMLGLAVIE